MMKVLQLPRTFSVVADCWTNAESDVRHQIRLNHPAALEEVITERFYGLFADRLRNANDSKSISRSFLRDLQVGIPELRDRAPAIARGIAVDLTLHGRTSERKSGGDLGFLILRPHVSLQERVVRVRDYKRGLLCQAKRKIGRRFGSLTRSQRNVLPDRLQYLAMLGYEFRDRDGFDLEPFKWQTCQDASVQEIVGWLARGKFPAPIGSADLIAALAVGRLGTDDENTIRTAISPVGNRVLELRIHWPDGRPPDTRVQVVVRDSNLQMARQQY